MGGPFIAPQGNLPVGVLETRTCPGKGPDISGTPLWNPAYELDMLGSGDSSRDKVERPDMPRLGVGHVQETSLEPS
jgi:hypothetical protein